MKYKKIILLLIVFSLVFVFSIKNVNAELVGGTLEIDTNDCIGKRCKVISEGTISLNNGGSPISGSIYKILDAYYNKTTNEVTYEFTETFANFLKESENYGHLTIDDYFALTSDEERPAKESHLITTSTLNLLLSKYATYTKTNAIPADYAIQNSVTAPAGAYLVLAYEKDSTFGVITANLKVANWNPTDGVNVWMVFNAELRIKQHVNSIMSLLTSININNEEQFISIFNNDDDDEDDEDPEESFIVENDISSNMDNPFTFITIGRYSIIPTNASTAVKNSNKLDAITIDFPNGIDYDINNIYYYYESDDGDEIISLITFDNGSCYVTEESESKKIADYTQTSNQLVIRNFYKYNEHPGETTIMFSNLKLNNNAVVGTAAVGGVIGNPIKTKYYYLVDAYTNDEATAFEEHSLTNTIYTYSLKINNKNNSEELLNGAVFGIYTDQACTNQIGENFTITANGTVTFTGIGEGTYYLKQEKAASGYRIIETNPMEIILETDDLVEDEYFEITVTSPASLLLPFTGGSGTIIFTCFGFVVVILSGLGIYLYTKKHKTVLEN